jgi:hypothetical protein
MALFVFLFFLNRATAQGILSDQSALSGGAGLGRFDMFGSLHGFASLNLFGFFDVHYQKSHFSRDNEELGQSTINLRAYLLKTKHILFSVGYGKSKYDQDDLFKIREYYLEAGLHARSVLKNNRQVAVSAYFQRSSTSAHNSFQFYGADPEINFLLEPQLLVKMNARYNFFAGPIVHIRSGGRNLYFGFQGGLLINIRPLFSRIRP